jgi:hypothetical protein
VITDTNKGYIAYLCKNDMRMEIPVSPQDKVAVKDDFTKRIGMALREVKLMKEGKIKEPSIESLLNEL